VLGSGRQLERISAYKTNMKSHCLVRQSV